MSGASSTSPFSAPSWSRRSCTAGNLSNSLRRVLLNSICRSTGPISAACSLTEERPAIEDVQAKAWALLVEGCDLPGGTASMPVRERGQGEPTPGQNVPFSGHVQAHTPGERRAFAPAATEDTGERDSPLEEAVRSELVSGKPNSLVSRENTGNFIDFGLGRRIYRQNREYNQSFT